MAVATSECTKAIITVANVTGMVYNGPSQKGGNGRDRGIRTRLKVVLHNHLLGIHGWRRQRPMVSTYVKQIHGR